jgi:predicted lipoprotein with Yx(FWY)xxD motif
MLLSFGRRLAVTGALLLTLVSGPAAQAQSAATLATADSPDLGTYLTDQSGMTLYMYTKDDVGVSNCYGGCAAAWPPLLTDAEPTLPVDLPGAIGTTARTDGTLQVTYNGMPLYYWASDQNPGDTTGQNVGGVWFVVNPAAPA